MIRYDGVPIDEWDLKQLRRRMAVVAQDTQLFATTIIENITYGMKPDEYTKEEVIQAAKAANGTYTPAHKQATIHSLATQALNPIHFAPINCATCSLSLFLCSLFHSLTSVCVVPLIDGSLRLHNGDGGRLRNESG